MASLKEIKSVNTQLNSEELQLYKKMHEFVKSYSDIYSFTKEKIDSELRVIIQYFYANSTKFNVNNVDLVDEAINY